MQNLIHAAVSQFANNPFPTAKLKPAKGLEVRQPPQKSLHTPTHTRTGGAGTGEVMVLAENINPQKIIDFIAIIHSLYPQYKIAFTPHTYLTTQLNGCSKKNTDLFFDLVQTFTLLHCHYRRSDVQNVLTTADEDYTQAYQLWQHCQPKKITPHYLPTVQLVLQLLQYRYQNQPFTQLNYTTQYIGSIFEQLQHQKRIQPLNTGNRQQTFELCH
jgi:hypothetical protein